MKLAFNSHAFILWKRQGGLCWICKQPISLEAKKWRERLSIDHIKPLSKSGSKDLSNKAVAHGICNSRRGAPDHVPDQQTIMREVDSTWNQQT